MSLFVDTSALLAFLDADQPHHEQVVEAWDAAISSERQLFVSNYVLVETFQLVQRRLGAPAVRGLQHGLVPLLQTLWVDDEVHDAAVTALLMVGRRGPSLVDCSSFELMRRHGLDEALALDADFRRQGFRVLPSGA